MNSKNSRLKSRNIRIKDWDPARVPSEICYLLQLLPYLSWTFDFVEVEINPYSTV